MGIQTDLMRPGERLESLQFQHLSILQKEKGFRFGTDAVLLADFADPRLDERIVDMGTGTGIIAILMASRQPRSTCVALEIQPDMADMASRSVALNGMQDQIQVCNCDFRTAWQNVGREQFTLVVCNPPYGKAGGTLLSKTDAKRISRHEEDCTIEEVAQAASRLLKCGGRFAVIFPAPRLFELMCAMRASYLEPKRIRTIHHDKDKAPKLVLVEAVKGGGSMLHWMPPLILNDEEGQPTPEWRRIYRADQ